MSILPPGPLQSQCQDQSNNAISSWVYQWSSPPPWCGSRAIRISRPKGACKRRQAVISQAASVEALPALADGRGSTAIQVLRGARDRANDMQAEAKAMARAANASVYTPELVSNKYRSRPIKVGNQSSIINRQFNSKTNRFFQFFCRIIFLLSSSFDLGPACQVLRRTMEILIGVGSFALKLVLDQSNGQLDQNKRIRAVDLRKICTKLGPTFVKIGQGLSTRPDLCPPEYLEELSQLQVFFSLLPFL